MLDDSDDGICDIVRVISTPLDEAPEIDAAEASEEDPEEEEELNDDIEDPEMGVGVSDGE